MERAGKRDKTQFVPQARRRMRTYRLGICLPNLNDHAWDVVHSIERKRISVVNPSHEGALADVIDAGGALLIDSDATLSVPLEDWLAVGCQRIRWQTQCDPMDKGVCGMYVTNWETALGFEGADADPHGPGVFVGEILLPRLFQDAWFECRDQREATHIVHALQLVIAHELVHVFDRLRYLAPAYMNWRAFYRNVLHAGASHDLLSNRLMIKSAFIDDYAGPNELAMLKTWWPSRAETWFRARRWLKGLLEE